MAAFGVPGGMELWIIAGMCLLVLGPLAVVAIVVVALRSKTKPPAQAAGWLADPTGRHELRYFDGVQWTESVSDSGVQGQDTL